MLNLAFLIIAACLLWSLGKQQERLADSLWNSITRLSQNGAYILSALILLFLWLAGLALLVGVLSVFHTLIPAFVVLRILS